MWLYGYVAMWLCGYHQFIISNYQKIRNSEFQKFKKWTPKVSRISKISKIPILIFPKIRRPLGVNQAFEILVLLLLSSSLDPPDLTAGGGLPLGSPPGIPPKTNKKGYPPKRGPRWPHKASKMSQDEIWGPFWVQNGIPNGPQNGQKNDLAKTLIFDTPLKRN